MTLHGAAPFIAAALFCASASMGTARADFPDEAIERALDASSVTYELVQRTVPSISGSRGRRLEQAARDFETGLATAAAQMSEEERDLALSKKTGSIKEELAAIAVHRRRQPAIYAEILRVYSPNNSMRRPLSPGLMAEHVSENYRLAWEFFVLGPSAEWQLRERATQALGAIGNPASAFVLLQTARVGYRQGILSALGEIPSRVAAEAALEVVAIANEKWGRPPERYEDWLAVFLVIPEAKRAGWLEVMRDLEKATPTLGEFARQLRRRLSIQRALAATSTTRPLLEGRLADPGAVEVQLDEASRELDVALTAAAANMTSSESAAALARETISIEAKLEAIAADRARRPQIYDEVRGQSLGNGRNRALATESHRLAWELLVLTPGATGASPGYEVRAAQTVGGIGNPSSAVTLLYVFGLNASREVPLTERTLAAQRLALDALVEMPSRQAAEAIASALIGARAYMVARERADWDATAHVAATIMKMPQAKRAAWLSVLRENDRPEGAPRMEPFAQALLPLLAKLDH